MGFRCVRLRYLIAGLILAAPVYSQALVPAGEASIAFDFQGRVPFFSGGAFSTITNNLTATPIINIFDRDGYPRSPVVFTIPGASLVSLRGVAVGLDGTVGLCGHYYETWDQRYWSKVSYGRGGGFVAWISPDHQSTRIVWVFPFFPERLTIAPDGTTWVQGHESMDPRVKHTEDVVRHFDKSGKLVGSLLPRSSIPTFRLGLSTGMLVSTRDRLGWYAQGDNQYFEITFDGQIRRYLGVPRPPGEEELSAHVGGLALTDNGAAFASTLNGELFRLNREQGVWEPVELPRDGAPDTYPKAFVLGAVGNTVVFPNKRFTLFRFFTVPD